MVVVPLMSGFFLLLSLLVICVVIMALVLGFVFFVEEVVVFFDLVLGRGLSLSRGCLGAPQPGKGTEGEGSHHEKSQDYGSGFH
jgi:hypothetical protein